MSLNHKSYFKPRNVFLNLKGDATDSMLIYDGKINNKEDNIKELKRQGDLRNIINSDGLISYYSSQYGTLNFNDVKKSEEEYESEVTLMNKIQVLIVVTIYNEEMKLLQRTLDGIKDNIKVFEKNGIKKEQIAMCLIQDGIMKIEEKKKVQAEYLEGIAEKNSDYSDFDVKQSEMMKIRPRKKFIQEQFDLEKQKNTNFDGFPPGVRNDIGLLYQFIDQDLTSFVLLKHLNAKKLSSHMWFFEGFCKLLNPKYCVLIDCGTKPDKDGIYKFYKALESDPYLGGVCGYMGLQFDEEQKYLEWVEKPNWVKRFFIWIQNFVDVRKAQLFEYTYAHILDKNFESFFGFLHVLPGAWSAYNYVALSSSKINETNLIQKQYLKSAINPEFKYVDHKEENMFLAEDRILSLGLYTQRGEKYYLKYILIQKMKMKN